MRNTLGKGHRVDIMLRGDFFCRNRNKKARLTFVNQASCGADETRTRDPRRDRPIF